MVTTLFFETEEKLNLATETYNESSYQNSIYHSYSAILNTAKALLIADSHKTNSQTQIIASFDENFIDTDKIKLPSSFADFVLRLKKAQASEELAAVYLKDATEFYKQADGFRLNTLTS